MVYEKKNRSNIIFFSLYIAEFRKVLIVKNIEKSHFPVFTKLKKFLGNIYFDYFDKQTSVLKNCSFNF